LTPPSKGTPDRGEPVEKGAVPRRIGRTKGGLNSKLHAVCDGEGKPLVLLLSEGQMSDHKGARLILDALPPAKLLLADRGYDSNWFRDALARKGCKPCIPSAKSRKIPLPYDKTLYKQRQKIEIKKIGGASPPVTTVAPTPSSQASASLHRSPSTSINES
jgi:transposase